MNTVWIYADKANLTEDGRHLALETSDGLVIVRLPKAGIEPEEDDDGAQAEPA